MIRTEKLLSIDEFLWAKGVKNPSRQFYATMKRAYEIADCLHRACKHRGGKKHPSASYPRERALLFLFLDQCREKIKLLDVMLRAEGCEVLYDESLFDHQQYKPQVKPKPSNPSVQRVYLNPPVMPMEEAAEKANVQLGTMVRMVQRNTIHGDLQKRTVVAGSFWAWMGTRKKKTPHPITGWIGHLY